MMLSRVVSKKGSDSNLSSGRLLHDIEAVSRALYIHKSSLHNIALPSNCRSKSVGKTRFLESNSNFVDEDLLHKDKKSSIWNWKLVKAVTHIRNQRFNCWFFLHVHSIEGLPVNFHDTNLSVHWKRKDEVMRTRPAKVFQGRAEFEETLMHQCSVYGSKNGHHHSAKYEPKLTLIYGIVAEAPGLDMGKHWIDLTKLLPLTLEELEDKKSSGKWTTSFKLKGKAKGGVLNVSFGFSLVRDNLTKPGNIMVIPKLLRESKSNSSDNTVDSGSGTLLRVGSVQRNTKSYSHVQSQSLDMKSLDETVLNRGSEPAHSIHFVSQSLDDAEFGSSHGFVSFHEHGETLQRQLGFPLESSCENLESDFVDTDFTIIEKGIEFPHLASLNLESAAQTSVDCGIETIDVRDIFNDDRIAVDGVIDSVYGNMEEDPLFGGTNHEANGMCNEELMIEKIGSSNRNLSVSELGDPDCLQDFNDLDNHENYTNNRSNNKAGKITRSLSLDDVTNSIANDFFRILSLEQNPLDLGADGDPESPRELLLRQFEEEALASGDFILNFDSEEEHVEFGVEKLDLPSVIRVNDKDKGNKRLAQSLRIKKDAELIENVETKALMKEWGFNEDVFQNSPCSSSGGFGSPIYLPVEESVEFPPLGEGLGSTVQTKDGGFLRSMNPLLFRNVKNGGKLIMQVSAPVVLPVAMGSSIMEILQHWASVGCEKMYMQVTDLMSLEDISGKMLQQVAWKIASRSEDTERLHYLLQQSECLQDLIGLKDEVKETSFGWGYKDPTSKSYCDDRDMDYVSLEGLAPLAMDKIETLSIEGLRIQSGMSDEEAPSSIKPQTIGEISTFLSNNVEIYESSISGIAKSEAKDRCGDLDELISLSLKLDEWMRLDAGIFSDDGEISERTYKIIEAHLAENTDFRSRTLKWGNPTGKSCGLLGNNFTVALRVQLRDPLRDYETVGAPMLSLIQVERVFVDPKPVVHCRVSEKSDNMEKDVFCDELMEGINYEEKQERIEEVTPLFKITEVHVAGFSIGPARKLDWGTMTQEQSGSRWLLASGMGEHKKLLHSMTNAIVRSYSQGMRKIQPRDTLWSISSHVHSPGAKWKELATLNFNIRNPDVIFLS